MRKELLVYLIGIFALAVLYYPLKMLLQSDMIFVGVVVLYVVGLRFLISWLFGNEQ